MRTLVEVRARLTEIRNRLQELDTEFAGQALPDQERSEFETLMDERVETERLIDELEAREEAVREAATSESAREDERSLGFNTNRAGSTRGDDIFDLSTVRMSITDPEGARSELRDRALRAIEVAQFPHDRANREDVQGHIERLLEVAETPDGDIARHLLATGSPTYKRAFGKALQGAPLSNEERAALATGSSATGGAAVPFQLDPTIIPTSNLSVNPYRAVSRVETIATNEWRGVTSDGVTARYSGEAVEVGGSGSGDDAPTLAQPAIIPERAESFIPFSIEIQQDWTALQAEMARLLQDAKDDLESLKFTVGAGHGSLEPQGVITGATTTTTGVTANAVSAGDFYKIEEALGPRFRPLAVWVANRAFYNKARQLDTAGGANLWMRLPQGLANQVPGPGNTGAELIGYAANEASSMSSTFTTGNKVAVLGDFRYYCIVDRIGMAVEIVPHLFGANRKPTGQRGFLAFWRNSAEVLSPNAFRVLVVA
jgi:HK97 family phage major capsid protein